MGHGFVEMYGEDVSAVSVELEKENVMSDFKAALADIGHFKTLPMASNLKLREMLDGFQKVVEAAQQEAEAWEVIELWLTNNPLFEVTLYRDDDTKWVAKLCDASGKILSFDTQWEALTRCKALTRAATWCRAELAK